MTNYGEQHMDAVVMQVAGTPAQALAYRSEPVPEPAPGEVLVEVHAAGVNPIDVVMAAGMLGTPLPMIPGIDFAGVVVSDGDRNGQEVWGSQAHLGWKRPGAHAQVVALPETWLSACRWTRACPASTGVAGGARSACHQRGRRGTSANAARAGGVRQGQVSDPG
jgi:NADPH:quinone reductase-like Zn-dependent oxidoreductase